MESWPPFAFAPDSDWGRCFVSFLRHMEERSGAHSTLMKYRATLIVFFTAPAKQPDAYTRADVEAFVRSPCRDIAHAGQSPTPGTMNNRLSILASFYRYAAEYGVPDASGRPRPLLQYVPPTAGLRHVQREQHYRTISLSDFTRFFAAIPTDTVIGLRDRALFLCYFWTARRRSEIVHLRVRDLEPAVFVDEAGGKRQGWRYHFRGKGHKGIDDMAELPLPAKEAIDRYWQASGRQLLSDDPVFTIVRNRPGRGKDEHHPLHPTTVWQILKRYAKKAGIDPKSITVHSFRHAAAQHRYIAGEDVLSLQHLLRHANLATTYTYLRALVGTADNGAKLLEDQFGKFSQSDQQRSQDGQGPRHVGENDTD